MELSGIPLHPLIVHLAVVFGPLAAVLALAFCLMPRYRWVLRWPFAVALLVAVGGVVLATMSGDSLLQSRPAIQSSQVVQSHANAGLRVRNVILAFGVLGALAVWRLPGASPLRPLDPPRADGPMEWLISAGTVILAVVVGLLIVSAGHSGARAVWG
jgi:uncharacterized membrane protein